MSEIPRSSDDIEQEAQSLLQKEQWIQSTAVRIAQARSLRVGPIRPDAAMEGARFASLWLDEFKLASQKAAPSSHNELRQMVQEAKREAWARAETDLRYPDGMPTLQLTIASHDAFCLGFGDEASLMGEILEWSLAPYGIS